ncbi:hypothetical protein H6G00_27310 [Leptolyngbya sp. FACHB-541]|nr:hypothetical protein [Leptolyngbya sp. FACHB-541]MBD2000270.1 hypothetical protein [Leptolyngbya sp. FACHB-541]
MTVQHSFSEHSDISKSPDQTLSAIVTVRPDVETLTRQRLPYFVGISKSTAGAKGVSMVVSQKPVNGKVGKLRHARFLHDVYCFFV